MTKLKSKMERTMRKSVNFVPAVVIAVCLTGCAGWHTKTNPAIKDTAENITTMAVDSSRKVVVIGKSNRSKEEDAAFKFCVEPSPDTFTGVDSDSQMNALLSASMDKPNISTAELAAAISLNKSKEISAQKLFLRTQGVQFFRDGSFALCQASINGDPEAKAQIVKLLGEAAKLIGDELPQLPQIAQVDKDKAIALAIEQTKQKQEETKKAQIAQDTEKEKFYYDCYKGKMADTTKTNNNIIAECISAVNKTVTPEKKTDTEKKPDSEKKPDPAKEPNSAAAATTDDKKLSRK